MTPISRSKVIRRSKSYDMLGQGQWSFPPSLVKIGQVMTELQRDWQKKERKKERILQRQNKTACLPSCKETGQIQDPAAASGRVKRKRKRRRRRRTVTLLQWKLIMICTEHLRWPYFSIQSNQYSTAPSPIDPVLTVQPDHCYIFFSLKNTSKNYFINYHNIIHLSLVRWTRQTLKTKPLIMLSIDWQIWQP